MNHLTYTTESIELQDYYYVLKRQILSRYEGSKTTSATYSKYTPITSSAYFVNNTTGSWVGDKSFGKTAAIDIETPYFIYFTSSSNASPEKPLYSNLNSAYLINVQTEELITLTSLGENYEFLENIFKAGDDVEIALIPSSQNFTYKRRSLYNVGLYKTVFSTSGSDYPSGSFLSGFLNAFILGVAWSSGSTSGSEFTSTPYFSNIGNTVTTPDGYLEFSSSLYNYFEYNPENPTWSTASSFSPLVIQNFNIDSLTIYGGTGEYDLFPVQVGDYFRFFPNYTLFTQSLFPTNDYINFYRTFDSQLTATSGAYAISYVTPPNPTINAVVKRYSFIPIENQLNNFFQLMHNLMYFCAPGFVGNVNFNSVKLDFRVYRKLNVETNLIIKKPNIQGSGIVLPKYFPSKYKKNIPSLLKKLNII